MASDSDEDFSLLHMDSLDHPATTTSPEAAPTYQSNLTLILSDRAHLPATDLDSSAGHDLEQTRDDEQGELPDEPEDHKEDKSEEAIVETVKQASPQQQNPSHSDEDEDDDDGGQDQAQKEENETEEEDLRDNETLPTAVTRTSSGGVKLMFTEQPESTEEDQVSRGSPSHGEGQGEHQKPVKDLIRSYERGNNGKDPKPPQVSLSTDPASGSPPDHSPHVEGGHPDQTQDTSSLAASTDEDHKARDTVQGTAEYEEKKELENLMNQGCMMGTLTGSSHSLESDDLAITKECYETGAEEAAPQEYLTPEANSPVGRHDSVHKEEEEEEEEEEDDKFVMAEEQREEHTSSIPQSMNTSPYVTPPWQMPPEQQSTGSRQMRGSPRELFPQQMVDPGHSPVNQEAVSLGTGAFRPVPQRPQQMWASQHEGLAHGHSPYAPQATWQWQQQQQQFPTQPQWPRGYNPNLATPPQPYRAGSPHYASMPRGQPPPSQYPQHQAYQHRMQHAQQVRPVVTPTSHRSAGIQGRGPGMQQTPTAGAHGQSLDSPHRGLQTPQSSTVCVKGVDSSIDLELLQLYFESPKKSGGDTVTDVSDHRQAGFILVTFEDPAVVQNVLERSHKVGQKTLSVSVHSEESPAEEMTDASRKVEVSGGAIVTDKDMIELYFESKKSGGGPIETVEVDEDAGVAVITFEDASAASEVLKREHKVGRTTLTVKPYQPPGPSSTIKVSGLKHNVSEDLLQLYFESERSGGGDVKDVKLDQGKGEALITFQDPSVLPNILQKNHIISKSAVTVSLVKSGTVTSERKSKESAEPPPALDLCVVEVSGLSEQTTEDTVQFYFENKRRSGGGPVKSVDLDSAEGVARITFESAEVAQSVVSQKHKLDGQQVSVSLCKPKAPVARRSRTLSTDASQLNTITVKGFKHSTSEDTLLNYFETKRSGGGLVQAIRIDQKKGVAFITFENAEDAARVASKKQVISGQTLDVSLHTPPKMMKDHILLTGLPELKSSDELRNFVEAKTSEEVKSILFGEEEGTAVVMFENEINFHEVQSALTKQKFMRKFTVQVEQVPVTSTVLVQGWPQDSPPTEDTLTNYFENAKRSGGGEVSYVELAENQEFALVTFTDTEAACRVANKKHKINKHSVDVCLFMECLGPSGGSEEPTPMMPDPLPIDDIYQQKISLLQEIPDATESLESTLRECHAYLSDQPRNGQLLCSLTPETEGFRQQVKEWAENTMKVLQDFLHTIHLEEVAATGEEFEAADGQLRELADENGVGLRYLEEDSKVFIVWNEPEKHHVVEKMKRIIDDIKKSLSRQKMEKKLELEVPKGKLELIAEHSVWQDLREKLPDLKVKLDRENGCVEFTGLEREIQEAKLCLLQVLSEAVTIKQDWDSELAIQLLDHPGAQSIIFAQCLGEDPEGRVEFFSRYLEIHSFDGRRAEAMQVAARSAVQRRVLTFTGENAEARTLPAWQELKESLLQKNDGLMKLQEDERTLTMVSVSPTIQEDYNALRAFINENSIQECAFELDQPFHGLLKSYLRERQLDLPFSVDDIVFDEDVGKIRVRGNKACIDAAEKMYNMFCRSIKHICKVYTEPSMKDFLQSATWRSKCLDIEHRLQCKILEPTPELESFLEQDDEGESGYYMQTPARFSPEFVPFMPEEESVPAVQSPSDGQQLRRRGTTRSRPQTATAQRTGPKPDIPAKPRIFLSAMSDITKEEHDVLVNSTNPELDLVNGLVSKALLGVGGPKLQQECKDKYPQGIKMGDVAVTGPGQQDGEQKLMCKRLFHCTLPTVSDTKDVDTIKKVVTEAVTKCLTTADELKNKEGVELKSIGLPALGTGTLKYPPQLVAQTMFQAVLDYGRQHPATLISDVNFIVYKHDKTNMQVFKEEHDKYNQQKQEARAWEQEESSESVVIAPTQAGVKKYPFFEETKGRVKLMFLGLNDKTVTEAESELMMCYRQRVQHTPYDVTHLEQWDSLNVNNLVVGCRVVNVDVTFNFSMGRVELRGFQENVDRIPVHDILKEAENQIRMRQNAKVMAQQVQWSCIEVDEKGEHLLPYDIYNNYKIEIAYRDNEPRAIVLDSENVAFIIDFTKMEETPENPQEEDTVAATVIRQDKIKESAMDAPLPDHWAPMNDFLDVVQLNPNSHSQEYNRVATQFKNSLKQSTAQIVKIERVQNATLYKQYMAMKKLMEKSANLPADRRLERERMWHGTKPSTLDGIIRYGFNRSYSNKNRSAYGQGAYFATEAEYSSRDSYAQAGSTGERNMFMCRVLVGEYAKGDQNMRLPPEIPNADGRRYNTTVDDEKAPTIFVTYSDVQAYPEYLIVFKDQ